MAAGPITLSLSGYTELPRGKIASVVTSLEMRRPFPSPRSSEGAPVLRRVAEPSVDWYRGLYRAIGEPWLWFSRLTMTEGELARTLNDPAVEVYAIDDGGAERGIVELDFRNAGECELAFFGLVPESVGQGLGARAMTETAVRVAASDVERFWVHTCTLDHPGALGFYRKHGLVPFARSIEVVDDPRLSGVLPRSAAPQVPMLE